MGINTTMLYVSEWCAMKNKHIQKMSGDI